MDRSRKIISYMARSMKIEQLIRWSGQAHIFPFYHTVSPESLPHISHLYKVIKPRDFEKDLERLLRVYEPLSMDEYLQNQDGKKGKATMVLSFDDGLKGCYDYLAPLLKKKGIPAIFFLNNRFIDNKGLFYRYKASLLIHQVREDCRARESVADFLKIHKEQVEASIKLIGWDQRTLLDALGREAELDYSGYLRQRPVYLNSDEIREILQWGFDIGGHSDEHREFGSMRPEQMAEQVRSGIKDLQNRFDISTAYFSFPFTSDGVPAEVIHAILEEGAASALLGTAGLKKTGRRAYIQRIPMEKYETGALETLKAEYFYYLLKMPLGRNRLRF